MPSLGGEIRAPGIQLGSLVLGDEQNLTVVNKWWMFHISHRIHGAIAYVHLDENKKNQPIHVGKYTLVFQNFCSHTL